MAVEVMPEELADVTTRYPYFSAAHQLLSRVYQLNHDHRFSDQLHHASLYATDRRKLYKYLKGSTVAGLVEPVIQEKQEISPTPENGTLSLVEAAVGQQTDVGAESLAGLIMSEEENGTSSAGIAGGTEVSQVTVYEEPSPAVLIKTDEDTENHFIQEAQSKTEIEISQVSATAIDLMEREILLEAMQSSMEMEVAPERKEEEPMPEENSYAAWIYRRSQRLHFGENEQTGKLESNEEPIPSAADDWLRAEFPATEATAEQPDENLPAFEHQPLSHGIRRISAPDEKSHQRDLVDRFISLEPNITRGKASEYAPGNIAKDSLEEDFSFVTETMAQLYARQGKMDKARKAYKKLIELYPEKSIYFAAQLKNLDKNKK